MADVRKKVREEYERFLVALPKLLETIAGKWVVFLDGEVQGVFNDDASALNDAVARYGVVGGFVVAPVAPIEVMPVTAGMLYSAP